MSKMNSNFYWLNLFWLLWPLFIFFPNFHEVFQFQQHYTKTDLLKYSLNSEVKSCFTPQLLNIQEQTTNPT